MRISINFGMMKELNWTGWPFSVVTRDKRWSNERSKCKQEPKPRHDFKSSDKSFNVVFVIAGLQVRIGSIHLVPQIRQYDKC